MKTIAKGAAVLLVIICAAFVCSAQEKLRRIEQPAKFTYSNTPIQVAVKMDGDQLPGRETLAGPDWLRRISLEVTNTSGKDINSLLINLILREPPYGKKATMETVGIVITFEFQHSEPKIKVLTAGDRVTLKPPVTMVDYWTKFALEHGMEDIEKVMLDIKSLRFTDETGWSLGSRTRKDPETGRYVFVADDSEPTDLGVPMSILIPDALRFFFSEIGLNFNEPETDPGGCVWLSFEESDVRIVCASSENRNVRFDHAFVNKTEKASRKSD